MISQAKLKKAVKPLYDKIESLKPKKVFENSQKIIYEAGGEKIEVMKPKGQGLKSKNRFR